jgi:putative inorganic carbon (HCO3(-)) transporter
MTREELEQDTAPKKAKKLKKERAPKPEKPPKAPKEPKAKRSYTGIASISLLISLWDGFWNLFCNALVKGFFGRIFSSYSKLQNSYSNGFIKEFLFKDRRLKKIFRKFRKFLSSNIETCFPVAKGNKMIRYFASAPLSFYGNFGLFFGIYTCVVYFVKLILPALETAPVDHLIVGIAILIISLPLSFSRLSFASAITRSASGRWLFQNCFGLSDEVIAKYATAKRGRGNLMLFFGLVAGTLTFFLHPLAILAAIIIFAITIFVAVTPEIGVVLTIFAVPFCAFMPNPTISLCFMVLTTAFFYAIKIIRGKRVFKLELVDMAILLFGILIYFASVFSAGGIGSTNAALVSCTLILGYFLLVNLMRTKKWISRCVAALISSACIVTLIGIFEFIFGSTSDSSWLDASFLGSIKLRIVSLFENPNVLATYLVLVFPFVLATLILAKSSKIRFLSFVASALFVCAIVMTWTRGAWIAAAVAALIFFTIYSRKTLRIFGVIIVAAPILPMLLPSSVVDRLISILNLSDSSISYRIYTWIGSIRLIKENFLGGIGYGTDAFKAIYPQYAFAGIEAAEHSHSLFLQILVAMGIGGLLTFLALVFLYFQKCAEYIKKPEDVRSKFYVAAALSSVIAMLIMGVFDYVWFNYRVFYVFWIVIAIGCAFVRVGNTEAERQNLPIDEMGSTDRDYK